MLSKGKTMLSFFDQLFLSRKNRVLIAAIISIVIVHLYYGLHIVWPGNNGWLLTVKHDWGAHYLGWHFFKNDSWHFPLGEIQNYMTPLGTNVGLTDSIPLLAIFFKLFSFILPENFQYFGLWLLACHFLTAYFVIALLRYFKVQSGIILLAAVLITANPVLLYRGLHPSLCAQWFILASFYLYVQLPDHTSAKSLIRRQLFLLFLSAAIHPYLTLMVFGFTCALLIKLFIRGRLIRLPALLLSAVSGLAGVVIIWYVIGLIGNRGNEDLAVISGYGLYGMNLNSLFNSSGFSSWLPQLKRISEQQYEGYMYLGAGFIIALALLLITGIIHLFSAKEKQQSVFKKISSSAYLPLTVIVVLLSAFAVSHVVSFNDKVLFTVPLPDFFLRLGDIFRASGRFFWPAYYALLILVFLYWNKLKWSPLVKTGLLLVITLIQFADIKTFFTSRSLSKGAYVPNIDVQKWTAIMQRFDHIIMYPPFETNYKEQMDYQYFSYLAAGLNKTISTGYSSRLNSKSSAAYVDSLNNMIADGELPENTLYITTPAFANRFYGARLNVLDGYCFLYSNNNKELNLLNLSDEANKSNQKLFDSLNSVTGTRSFFTEQQLPAYVNDALTFQVEGMVNKKNFIRIKGWSFVKNTDDNKGDSVFITLSSPLYSFIAKTEVVKRDDVTSAFGKKYLDDAGFEGSIYKANVPRGVYKVGMLIKTKEGTLLHQITDKVLRVGVPEFGTLLPRDSIPLQADIKSNLEHTDLTDSLLYISGWGFLQNEDAAYSEITFLLIKDNKYYSTATEPSLRSDVSDLFKEKADNSGFSIYYQKKDVPKGKYKTGIIIKNTKTGKERAYLYVNEVEIK